LLSLKNHEKKRGSRLLSFSPLFSLEKHLRHFYFKGRAAVQKDSISYGNYNASVSYD
jgi:hypothetical protein